MDDKKIYERSKDLGRGNLGSIFLTSLVFSIVPVLIFYALDKIFPTLNYVARPEEYFSIPREIFGDATYLDIVFGQPYRYGIIKNFIINALTTVVLLALSMAILDFVIDRENGANRDFQIDMFIENLLAYFKEIIFLSLVIAFISLLIAMIPYVGFILQILFKIILIFVAFAIKENKEKNPLALIKESFRRTNGHKLNLLKIAVKYYLLPLAIMLLYTLVTTFILKFLPIGLIFLPLGIILFLVLMLRATYLINIAYALYYKELLDLESFKANFGRREDPYLEEVDTRKNLEVDNKNY